MGSTKEEMKPSTKSRDVQTVNAADMVGKKGGFLSRIADKMKKTSPQKTAKNFADLTEDFADLLEKAIKDLNFPDFAVDTKLLLTQIDLRLQDMILTKRKELKSESGDEDYNRQAIARLMTMDWHFQSIAQILNSQLTGKETPLMLLELIEYHLDQIGELAVEYYKSRDN